MRLELKNIGKLSKADIEFNGITVIAGQNNTGKSTVGKALYSMFNGLYDIPNKLANERKNSISRVLGTILSDDYNRNYRFLTKELYSKFEEGDYNSKIITNMLSEYVEKGIVKFEDDADITSVVEKIISIFKISDEQLLSTLLKKSFVAEFNNRINNVYIEDDHSIVKLTIKKKTMVVEFEANEVLKKENIFSLNTESIYVDDPFIVDDLNSFIFFGPDHRDELKKKLRFNNTKNDVVNEIITDDKLERIYEKINGICDGDLIKENYSFEYKMSDAKQNIDVKNISTGLKTFIIIKTLLKNGEIGENSTLILDEPEIHLHPEWQIVFAEIIVLLQKEFNMNILINTHSPYFLEAIEVYSEKYKIDMICKYYLAENSGNISTISDVTKSTELIYKKLAKPFQTLENVRFSDD